VLSPLKKVVAPGVPVALNVDVMAGAVVGFVTVLVIKVLVPPDIVVTVPSVPATVI
jgi:hypothetical protein